MGVMRFPDFLPGFRDLCSAFGKRIDGEEWERLKNIYWRTCRNLDEAEWLYSVQNAIENEARFPFPARLIGSAREQRKTNEGARCHACGRAPATFRTWCGECALASPEESGIRIERPEDERDEERRLLEVVRANPRREGEDAPVYVHRLAVAAGLLSEDSEPLPF